MLKVNNEVWFSEEERLEQALARVVLLEAAIKVAVKEERERCAKISEAHGHCVGSNCGPTIAAKIRDRV